MFTVDHIAIAVPDLDEAVATYCKLLDYPQSSVEYHDVPSESVRVAMLRGNTTLELLESSNPESSIARFVEKRGAGLHHLCFETGDVVKKLATLNAAELTLLDTQPRTGAEGQVIFVHPKSAGGVLVEFVQK